MLTRVTANWEMTSINAPIETPPCQPVATSAPTPTRILAPIPATVITNGPPVTAAPLANNPTESAQRLSGENNYPSPIRNTRRPSRPMQSISQALNGDGQKPSDELGTTTLTSVGDSTTLISAGDSTTLTSVGDSTALTITTGHLQRTNSSGTSSDVQRYTIPAVT
jgi:hypothetical protein